MSRLTDRTFTTGVSTTDLIHIVVTGDTSQSSDGSSYKATIQQVIDLITGTTGSSGTSGTNGTSGSNGTSGTSGTSPVNPFPFVYGLFSQTGNSATVSGTTVETSIIDGGVGTLTVPANGFSIGDSFNVTMGGLMTVKPGGDTLTLRIKTGSVVLSDTGPLSLSQVTNDVWQIMISFTVRTIGGPGTASIVTLGNLHVIKTASGTPYSYAFNTLNNTTFDTTSSNTLDITIQWGSNNTTNSIYSDVFLLNKVY